MNITVSQADVNDAQAMIVAFDVGMVRLNSLCRLVLQGRKVEIRDECGNRMRQIESCLREYQRKATELGLRCLHVVCEPTGGYERKLLGVARRLGCTTAYVSGQAVHQSLALESNDTGKSDHKDPGTIHTLARLGKTLQTRELSDPYQQMRRLNEMYEDEDKTVVSIRTHLHAAVAELFVDWPMVSGFLFTGPGAALVKTYGCSPYRIVADGRTRFQERLRGTGCAVRVKTVAKLWQAAESSVRHLQGEGLQQILQARVCELYADWQRHEARREQYGQQLARIYEGLPEAGVLNSLPSRISHVLLARLVAETGPMRDFRHIRQLWRYAGLNLRERSSGTYVGQTRISKKGRSLLRKVLYQIVFSHLIVKGGLYSATYRRKKAEMANGMKAIVAIMRHFLKCVHALVRSGQEFTAERLFLSPGEVAA